MENLRKFFKKIKKTKFFKKEKILVYCLPIIAEKYKG